KASRRSATGPKRRQQPHDAADSFERSSSSQRWRSASHDHRSRRWCSGKFFSSEIQIDIDGKNAASIRSGQSFFKILGLPEEEFPPLPKFEDAKVVTIRQKDLRDGLRRTSYAISTDETRYVLNGRDRVGSSAQ